MNKIKNFFFHTRQGRIALFTFILILGVVLLYLSFRIDTSNLMLSVLLFEISFFCVLLFLIAMALELYQSRKLKFVENSYYNLYKWIKYNDIGNATNIIKSLSNEDVVKKYFRDRRTYVASVHKDIYAKKWVSMDKNSFLIESIRDLISTLDVETRRDLIFLEKYINYKVRAKTTQDKVLNGLVSVTAIAGFLGCIKYSIDLMIRGLETKNNDVLNIGILLLGALAVIFVFVVVWFFLVQKKRSIEDNSKNFLDLLFKVLKEDKYSE